MTINMCQWSINSKTTLLGPDETYSIHGIITKIMMFYNIWFKASFVVELFTLFIDRSNLKYHIKKLLRISQNNTSLHGCTYVWAK